MDLTNVDLSTLTDEEVDSLYEGLDVLKKDSDENPFFYFHPLPTQQKFLDSEARIKVLFGGNQSGKTTVGAFDMIKDCLENPEHHWWAGSETTSTSITVQQYKVSIMLPKDEIEPGTIYSSTRGFRNQQVKFKNGSTIVFKTFAQERERWQGATLHGIWLDEECPWDIYNECLPRLLAYNGTLLCTMTALCGYTKMVEELLNGRKSKGIDVYFLPTYENIKQNGGALTISQITDLENRYDDPAERKARLEGIPSPKSGLIFKMFKDQYPSVIPLEKVIDLNPKWPTIVSIDPHSNTPHSVLWIQVGPTGDLWVKKERPWLKDEGRMDRVSWITLTELATWIDFENRNLNIDSILLDKHGSNSKNAVTGTTIEDELYRVGLITTPAGGEVEKKILLTQRYMKEGKIHIDATCWNLLWEIRRYVWMEFVNTKSSERREEHQKPKKKDDHLVDCLMNAVLHISSVGITITSKSGADYYRRNPMEQEQVNQQDLYTRREFSNERTLLSIYE